VKRTWNVICSCLLAGLICVVPGAEAALKPGICTVQLTMSFGSAVKIDTTADVTVSLSGGADRCGPIPTTNIPDGLLTTMSVTSATGSGKVAACTGLAAVGTSYGITFGQHYGPSNGSWVYAGGAAGGELILVDMDSPVLVGIAELVLDPLESSNANQLEACTIGAGMTQLRFLGVLTFVDP